MSDENASPRDGQSDQWFAFEMGEFSAVFPRDRWFVTNHMWAKQMAADRWRFGLTSYAVRLLQDVYFLDWVIEPGQPVAVRANIGSIESKKAESDLFAPIAGTFDRINEATIDDPSLINADAYEEGWLIEMVTDPNAAESFLQPDQYAEHLAQAWDVAQRTIKGQVNQ